MKKNRRVGMYAIKSRLFTLVCATLFSLLVSFSAAAQSVVRGPYLQQGADSSTIIKWRTDVATTSSVDFGTTQGNLDQNVVDSASTTEHEVQLTGLIPYTSYFYSIGDSSGPLAGDDTYHFRTSPNPGIAKPTRIWVIGDSGTANSNARAVRDRYKEYTGSNETHLWLMLGDNAYNSGTDSEYQAAVFETYPEILRQLPLWPTLGNHDGYSADSSSQSGPYYDIFTLPRNAEVGGAASGTEAYYSFEYGNIHFVVLDSYDSDRSSNGGMLTWLENDLAANQKEWVIAFWHHPPYTKGSHNSDTETELIQMRENALPILESWGVDLVLGGHSHSYERSYLIDGEYDTPTLFNLSDAVDSGDGKPAGDGAYSKSGGIGMANQGAVYVVAGSSGLTGGGSLNHPVMYTSLNELGSMILDIDANQLNASFLNSNGVVRDSFTISKGPDITSPAITTVSARNAITVQVSFSEPVSLSTAENPLNYAIDGGITVNTAVPDANGSTVLLGVSTLTPGVAYTLTINDVQDLAGNSIATDSQQQFSYELTHTIDTRISSGSDDVEEELASGDIYFDSSDIELVDDASYNGLQAVGLRFQNIDIPQGATIDAAYLEFVVDETGSTATNLEIHAEATDNAPAFTANNKDVTNRTLTSAATAWDIPAWNTVGDVKQSPDITDAVQEVVDRTGWSTNSAMVFVINGTGTRTAEAYEGVSSAAALLHVEYTTAVPGAPIAGFNFTTTELAATFTDVSSDSDGGSIVGWAWGFGDANTSVLQNPVHTYAEAGSYTVALTVTDNDGATNTTSQPVTVTPPPDFEPPSTPVDLSVQSVGPDNVTLSWSASSDNQAVASYEVIRDGQTAGTTTQTSFTDIGLTPLTTYSYQVVAIDASGNRSTASSAVAATTGSGCSVTGDSALILGDNKLQWWLTNSGLQQATISHIDISWPTAQGNLKKIRLAGDEIFKQVLSPPGASIDSGWHSDLSRRELAAGDTAEFKVEFSLRYKLDIEDDYAINVAFAEGCSVIWEAAIDTEPPTTPSNLRQSGATTQSITLAWDDSSDNVGVTGYEVFRDGVLVDTVTATSYTDSGLAADTSYDYDVVALDAAGNRSAPGSTLTATTAAEDFEPPTAPASLSVVSVSANSVELSWAASSDNQAVAGYRVYRDAQLVGDTASTAYTDAGLLPESIYQYYVVAYDAAGNDSVPGNTVDATTAAGGCIVTADSFLILGDNKIEWDLTNESPETINISMLEVAWPAAQGNLKRLKLDGGEFYNIQQPPPGAVIDGNWKGDLNKREIKSGDTRRLKVEFTKKYKNDVQSDYALTVQFVQGCSVSF